MKSLIRISLLLLLMTAMITSCKKAVPKQTQHIPKTALVVATINTKSLQNKLMKSQVSLENILKSASGGDTAVTKGKQELEDLKGSGLDLDDNFYIAVVQKGGGTQGSAVVSAIGTLKDGSKLEAYIKKKQPKAEIRKEKYYNYISTGGNNMVAWGDDLVVAMSYQKSYAGQKMEFDSTTGTYNFKTPVNADNDLKAEMDLYFNLKEDQSVASIPEFRDLMQDKSDGSLWVNSSSSLENIPLPLPKLKELFANSFTAATLNFEDGKIAVNSKSYYSNEMRDILKKYTGPTADLDAITRYPSANINGFMALSFNPEFFNGLVKYMELGGMVDGWLTRMMGTNYTLTEALKAIKGDVSIVVSDFQIPANPGVNISPAFAGPNFKMVANIPVGDKTQMNRIMDKLSQSGMVVKTPNGYSLNQEMSQMGFVVTIDDKNIFIAKDEALLNQYKTKSGKATLPDNVMDDFKGKSAISYMNIESLLNGVPAPKNGSNDSIFLKAKSTFKDAKFYLENFNGKYMEGHYELRFKDEKQNSLTSLINFFETVSKNTRSETKWSQTEADSILNKIPTR